MENIEIVIEKEWVRLCDRPAWMRLADARVVWLEAGQILVASTLGHEDAPPAQAPIAQGDEEFLQAELAGFLRHREGDDDAEPDTDTLTGWED